MAAEITSQKQLSEWVREQYQRADKHLAEQGILFESVVAQECRYLAQVLITKAEMAYLVLKSGSKLVAKPLGTAKISRDILDQTNPPP